MNRGLRYHIYNFYNCWDNFWYGFVVWKRYIIGGSVPVSSEEFWECIESDNQFQEWLEQKFYRLD